MKTTLGNLISGLFDAYEHRYHDAELAALATQVTVNELLSAGDRHPRTDGKGRGTANTRPLRRVSSRAA